MGWAPWAPWSTCHGACDDVGERRRVRACSSPPPVMTALSATDLPSRLNLAMLQIVHLMTFACISLEILLALMLFVSSVAHRLSLIVVYAPNAPMKL
ncbi:hypothetical protein EVAR_39169_1 [Eumeta japonica]|uniref:Uncharacterized protein n=1 Tax=Eumeta variegata TaxID=151549 RepID=A0A4C1S9Y5_EUMVA|nr:hypothetical protein EVAR_39169_1 [Eumeta japonica]